jgi:hypothetical protein
MAAPGIEALKRIAQARQALRQALEAACTAYANGAVGQGSPIVDDRFKGGGNRRFTPLTADYAAEKRGRAKALRGGMKAAGRVVSKGSGALPILVRTGLLRERVSRGRRHRIVVAADGLSATIYFTGLPGYAIYHHTGAGKLPVRSPVQPNAADLAAFKAVMLRVLRARINRGSGTVAPPTTMAGNSTPRVVS